jgi:histidyl-tRNA synthetase
MSASSFQAPKGTRDLSGADARAFSELENISRRIFSLHGYEEVRTPLFESAEVFSRSLGETSDVVEKEMFTFTDRGERVFSLRPEGTAGVVRFFVENSLWSKPGAQRFFYSGPMFRAERPQAGRYRQFWQIGSENFGAGDPSADADTVAMAYQILKEAGLANVEVHVNSLGCASCRPQHRSALLAYLKSKETDLTDESKKRMGINPLRVLDSKVDGPKLKDAPVMTDFLCPDCKAHHDLFLDLIKLDNITPISNPRLVRGLDYYSRSVFEFVSPDLGAQSAVAAGGRYDDLVKLMGGPDTPAVGFALGMDRVVLASSKLKEQTSKPGPSALVLPMDESAVKTAYACAAQLRQAGVSVAPVTASKKMKTQLSNAADSGVQWAVIIGEDELKSGVLTVKNLSTREQKKVDRAELVQKISASKN